MHMIARTTTRRDPMQPNAEHERREDALAVMLAKDMIPLVRSNPDLRDRVLRAANRVVKERDAHHEDALIAAHEIRNAKAVRRL